MPDDNALDMLTREQALELLRLATKNLQDSVENTVKLLQLLEQTKAHAAALEVELAQLRTDYVQAMKEQKT